MKTQSKRKGNGKMKAKQIIGIVVTGVVIIATGVTGVVSNIIRNRLIPEEDKASNFWGLEETVSVTLPAEDFVGVINVVGEIGPSSDSIWAYEEGTYNHDLYMEYVDEMMYADNNKGILLYIDSPGGTVYESDELYLKLMEYKEVTGRPIWAYFASQACSGGYYIGMAADKVYANRNCWTGSIGVIVSLMNCKDLYDKLGIKEIDITSGANKAMGSSGLDLTQEQYDILQSLVDEAYDQFVGIVSTGRGMDEETVRTLADGRIYSAKQALELNLVDAVGSLAEEKAVFAEEARFSEDILYYEPEDMSLGFMSSFFGMLSELKPQSDTELAKDIMENNGNGVLKYYAE